MHRITVKWKCDRCRTETNGFVGLLNREDCYDRLHAPPEGWTSQGSLDFCPKCAAAFEQFMQEPLVGKATDGNY